MTGRVALLLRSAPQKRARQASRGPSVPGCRSQMTLGTDECRACTCVSPCKSSPAEGRRQQRRLGIVPVSTSERPSFDGSSETGCYRRPPWRLGGRSASNHHPASSSSAGRRPPCCGCRRDRGRGSGSKSVAHLEQALATANANRVIDLALAARTCVGNRQRHCTGRSAVELHSSRRGSVSGLAAGQFGSRRCHQLLAEASHARRSAEGGPAMAAEAGISRAGRTQIAAASRRGSERGPGPEMAGQLHRRRSARKSWQLRAGLVRCSTLVRRCVAVVFEGRDAGRVVHPAG